ncbi:hypothetical protein BRC86_01430 [Halobacteriales archaeon QS_3_64_16]|nr:MAG: hypothetical protein BRC86_01430 [Halobacteriales archaeon QS_3_64_16]
MALRADLETMVENEGVHFLLEVTNDGNSPAELTFRDAGKADFAVYENGSERDPNCEGEDEREERWRWSEGRMFAQVLQTDRLEPGASSRYEGRWESPDPGTYFAWATLRAQDWNLEATGEFSVES